MAYGKGKHRSGPIVFTLFAVLLLATIGALVFAVYNGMNAGWSTNAIWITALAAVSLLVAIVLFGYFLGTSSTVDRVQRAYRREVDKIQSAFSNALAIDPFGKSKQQFAQEVEATTGVKLEPALVDAAPNAEA